MYTLFPTRQYKKSYKRISRSGKYIITEIEAVIDMLASGMKIPPQYHDHALTGDLEGYRECHIKSDLLLIYTIKQNNLVLILINIGSHSELFE